MPKLTRQQQRNIIQAAEQLVRQRLQKDTSGHDWYHIDRVRRIALRIGKKEKVDLFLVELMALLHDLHDRKIVGSGNEEKELRVTEQWLQRHGVHQEHIDEIVYVIKNQSYSASGITGKRLTSSAGQVMQDADRLDALGAIGIARCFTYGGKTGHPMHDPVIAPVEELSAEEYMKENNTSLNHFYEKLFKLKDLMNTKTGKQIAAARHAYMKAFVKEFLAEWDGKK
jgi:uncharacterized protein